MAWAVPAEKLAEWARDVVHTHPLSVIDAYVRELLLIATIDSPFNPKHPRKAA